MNDVGDNEQCGERHNWFFFCGICADALSANSDSLPVNFVYCSWVTQDNMMIGHLTAVNYFFEVWQFSKGTMVSTQWLTEEVEANYWHIWFRCIGD